METSPLLGFLALFVGSVIGMFITSFFLWFVGKFFVPKKKNKYTTALMIMAVSAGIGFVLSVIKSVVALEGFIGGFISLLFAFVNLMVLLSLIKYMYGISWLKSLALWLITGIIYMIVYFIFVIILVVGVLGVLLL